MLLGIHSLLNFTCKRNLIPNARARYEITLNLSNPTGISQRDKRRQIKKGERKKERKEGLRDYFDHSSVPL